MSGYPSNVPNPVDTPSVGPTLPPVTYTTEPPATTTSSPPPTTSPEPPTTSNDPTTKTTTIDPTTNRPTTTNPPVTSNTPTPNVTTPTTTTPSMIISSKPVMTSSAVPIVTVSTSGNSVYTYTSTSYSSYETMVPTLVSSAGGTSTNPSSNTGAIVGGVVGGIAGIALIGFAFFLMKRRSKSKKSKYVDDENRRNSVNPQPFNDYNTYGSPTMVGTDVNSLSTGRPMSMGAAAAAGAVASGAKPRPFVQAYNPEPPQDQQMYYDNYDPPQQQNYNSNKYDLSEPSQPQQYYDPHDPSHAYDSHDPTQSPYSGTQPSVGDPQQQYYDYQGPQQLQQQQYGVNNSNYTSYPPDGYYAHQTEPMIPVSTSKSTGIAKMGRNVPDEVDYPRHVPDEIDSVPPRTN